MTVFALPLPKTNGEVSFPLMFIVLQLFLMIASLVLTSMLVFGGYDFAMVLVGFPRIFPVTTCSVTTYLSLGNEAVVKMQGVL